jgi:predicted nucleotidyltransferase
MESKTEVYKEIIIPIIRKHLPDAKIILYGSRARKDESERMQHEIVKDGLLWKK